MVHKKIIFLILLIFLFFAPLQTELKYTTLEWKDGARAAVCITFDWEDDYPHSIYVSERPADLKGDLPEKTDRILRVLNRHGARATFFVVGIVAEEFRDSFEQIKAGRHEIASHGDYHGGYSQLGIEDPQAVPLFGDQNFDEQLSRIEEAEELIKTDTAGFRAPGLAYNNDTLLALESLGYLYDSNLQSTSETRPFHPVADGEQLALLEIPIYGEDASSWDLYGRKYDGPDPSRQWERDFKHVYDKGGVYVALLHPAFIGKDSHLLATLEEFLGHIRYYDVWVTTMEDLARWHLGRENIDIDVLNPKGTVTLLVIENKDERMEGLTVEVNGKARAFGNGAVADYDGDSTKITFPVLEKGRTRTVLVRV